MISGVLWRSSNQAPLCSRTANNTSGWYAFTAMEIASSKPKLFLGNGFDVINIATVHETHHIKSFDLDETGSLVFIQSDDKNNSSLKWSPFSSQLSKDVIPIEQTLGHYLKKVRWLGFGRAIVEFENSRGRNQITTTK